ncbi:MAG: TlpA family protein disulfide reductase [Gemmataceae bacterium]|nr:TlpA family protein disulfide reductase [Gemmataceae bacterium]
MNSLTRPRSVLLGLAGFLLWLTGCDSPAIEGKKIGNRCPEIAGTDADGKLHRLSDQRGKVVFVSFWAPWCAPCRTLIPHERELVESKYAGRPFAIVAIALDSPEAVREFTKTTAMPWPNIIDGRRGPKARTWDIEGIPAGILIDHQGIIRGLWLEGINPSEVDRAIETAMKAAEKN